MLTLNEDEWAQLIAFTRKRFEESNTRNRNNNGKYEYSVAVEDYPNAVLLRTRQKHREASLGGGGQMEVVGRRKDDGALMKIIQKRTKTGWVWTGKQPPKRWEEAWRKGGLSRLANAIGLTAFFEIGEVRVVGGSSSVDDQNRPVEHRIIRGHDVKIVREDVDNGWWRVTYDGCEWMGELYETFVQAEAAARDWCSRNPKQTA